MSFGSGPVRKSVSGVDGDVGGLYVIVYGWCWSMAFSIPLFSCMINKCFILQIVSPSFGVLLLLLEGWFCEGDFFRPRMLAALEIGANEDVSLEVWRGHSWVDDCACLLMLPPSCFWFSCTQFIVWLSLSTYHPRLVTLVWCPSVVFEKWGRLLLPMGAYSSRDRPKCGCQSFS